jgi:hypothetical protein
MRERLQEPIRQSVARYARNYHAQSLAHTLPNGLTHVSEGGSQILQSVQFQEAFIDGIGLYYRIADHPEEEGGGFVPHEIGIEIKC